MTVTLAPNSLVAELAVVSNVGSQWLNLKHATDWWCHSRAAIWHEWRIDRSHSFWWCIMLSLQNVWLVYPTSMACTWQIPWFCGVVNMFFDTCFQKLVLNSDWSTVSLTSLIRKHANDLENVVVYFLTTPSTAPGTRYQLRAGCCHLQHVGWHMQQWSSAKFFRACPCQWLCHVVPMT